MLASIFDFVDPQDTLGSFYCSLVHQALMWPIHGHYNVARAAGFIWCRGLMRSLVEE